MIAHVRCRDCLWYNYNFFDNKYIEDSSFCGLHGGAYIDPDGPLPNFLNQDEPGCAFCSKFKQPTLW